MNRYLTSNTVQYGGKYCVIMKEPDKRSDPTDETKDIPYKRDDLYKTLIPPEFRFDQTEEFRRHPFTIRCNRCGSGKIRVVPFDHMDLEIKCKTCGAVVDCGVYDTDTNDYSDCLNN